MSLNEKPQSRSVELIDRCPDRTEAILGGHRKTSLGAKTVRVATVEGHPRDMQNLSARTTVQVSHSVTRFQDLGVNELILDPTIADPDQIDRLAEVLL